CNRQLAVEGGMKKLISGANGALLLLLGINLFNYIDRQILAALEPDIRASFFAPDDVNAMTKTGLLGDAFFVTYMISAPILGLLADRFSRWIIVGSAVILWSRRVCCWACCVSGNAIRALLNITCSKHHRAAASRIT